jgi:hypothetical protein
MEVNRTPSRADRKPVNEASVHNQIFSIEVKSEWPAASVPLRSSSWTAVKWIDEVPVMPVTVLAMELLLHEPSVDLGAISGLVLNDLGAAIHIFHLVGQENATCGGAGRVQDCLAGLDMDLWFRRISHHAFLGRPNHPQIVNLWKHSHSIAQWTQWVAGALDSISAESAYLIGLLHEVRGLARLLGRAGTPSVGELFGGIGGVPPAVCAAFSESGADSTCLWNAILKIAHDLAWPGKAPGPLLPVQAENLRSRILRELCAGQAA